MTPFQTYSARVGSIELKPTIVHALPVGKVRALLVPTDTFGRFVHGDLIWVREAIRILSVTRDRMRVSYAGFYPCWMPRRSDPGHTPREAGIYDARAMPIAASRFTLLVKEVVPFSWPWIAEDDAWQLGASQDALGWLPLGASGLFKPYDHPCQAVADIWLNGGRPRGDLVMIRFDALARNVGDVAFERGL